MVLLPDVESMFWVIAGEAEEVGVSVCNDHIDFFAKFSDWDESCEYVELVERCHKRIVESGHGFSRASSSEASAGTEEDGRYDGVGVDLSSHIQFCAKVLPEGVFRGGGMFCRGRRVRSACRLRDGGDFG